VRTAVRPVLLLGIIMMAGACGSNTEPPPPPERLNNEIVFNSNRVDQDGRPIGTQLYRMRSDGSDVRRIPRIGGSGVGQASISPDGQWIAYSSGGNIWLIRPDGSEEHKLTLRGFSPAWSPDGTQIAFYSDRAGQPTEWDIFVMNADGSNITQITNDPALEGNPSWSPDGLALTYWHWSGDISDPFQVYVSTLDGQPPVNISNNPADEEPLAWSPDGRSILVRSDRDLPNPPVGLYLIDPDGSTARLISLPFLPGDATWKPDGSRIVVEEAEGDHDLWSLNPDGTDLVNLTKHPALDRFPAWSR
jgi:Tol biopolymer transport system component